MKRTTIAAAAAASLSIFAGAAHAQTQEAGTFSLELRTGAGMLAEELGPTELGIGGGLEILLNWRVMPHLELYGGWDWQHFSLKEDVGIYTDAEDTGYAFGARFFAPSLGSLTPWIRAGGLYDHLELEGEEKDEYVRGDHELGWEVGAGFAMPLGRDWSFLPGVRYRAFPTTLAELGGESDLRYLALDIGFSRTFGGPSIASMGH